LISLALIMILVYRGVNVAAALAGGTLLLGVLTLGPGAVEAASRSLNAAMAQTVLALFFAMFLAGLYGEVGASERLVEGLRRLGTRAAALSIPAIVGLLPMPGGAYVSALMVDKLYDELGLTPAWKTYLNYWFRHIWITVWPLYQGVILASGLLGIPVAGIISANLPIFLASLAVGAAFSIAVLRAHPVDESVGHGGLRSLIHLWPFPAIAVLSLYIHLSVAISIGAVAVAFTLIHRPGIRQILRALRYALNPTFIAVIIFSFICSGFIESAGIAEELLALLGPYADLAVFSTPLIIVLATGVEFTFVALAFPPLIPLLSEPRRILLAFAGGFAGAMLSPSHSCLILSAHYYKSSLPDVYRLLIPSVAAALLLLAPTLLLGG